MAKNKNILIRYFKIFKRGVKNLTAKKVLKWLKKNLKGHPFVLGFLFIIWINRLFFSRWNIKILIAFHILIFASWLILVFLSNSLRDTKNVRWYFKKRFVFFMLVLLTPLFLTPLALVFLWAGSFFKRSTKIALTGIFSLLFILNYLAYYKKYEKQIRKTSLETTIEMITSQKRKVYIKKLENSEGILANLELAKIPLRLRHKLAVSDISARCSPAVVAIKTKDKYGDEMGIGSGFIISQDGLIVTNFHVLSSSYQIEIKVGEKVFKDAYLVVALRDLDIAILKIDAQDLPLLPIGNSDNLVTGQFIIVVGNPWGFEHSVSSGIISALRSKGDMKLIQMTAPVSPGSSGGPVLNEYAEVIGITTIASIFMAQNLNFAIPISYLRKAIEGNNLNEN